jgi:hypothetical protein
MSGISKNYCVTNSGSTEVVLRFRPWLILFKFELGGPDLSFTLCQCECIEWPGRGLRSASGDRTSG